MASDTALTAVVGKLVENSPFTADDIAAAVLEGMAHGEDVIVPDQAARQAWGLKQRARSAYDAVMRAPAATRGEAASPGETRSRARPGGGAGVC